MDHPQTVYFEEKQHFAAWVGALLVAVALAPAIGALATGEGEAGFTPALLAVATGIAVATLFLSVMALTTVVTDAGIRVKGFVFIDRLIGFDAIDSAVVRRYRPLVEYGGWGFRLGPSGKAYNTRGDEGVQLLLRDGGRVLIGSARAQELAHAITARLKA